VTPAAARAVIAAIAAITAATSAHAGECGACPCGAFDEPDRVTRAGIIDLSDAHVVTGSEIYLANRSLAAGGEGKFVVSGGETGKPGALRFQARDRIVLRHGFEAHAGSRFEASLVPRPRPQAPEPDLRR
jgi:hypothetical protein